MSTMRDTPCLNPVLPSVIQFQTRGAGKITRNNSATGVNVTSGRIEWIWKRFLPDFDAVGGTTLDDGEKASLSMCNSWFGG